jgi:hypothetical protein
VTSQAQAYFDDVEAPLKRMELISDAGHFAMFLQPDLFLQKLLTHVRPLADTNIKAVHPTSTEVFHEIF